MASVCLKLHTSSHEAQIGLGARLVSAKPPPPVRLDSALPAYPLTMGIAVHTQGGAHTRRSVATAGVLLFKGGAGAGPRVKRSEL